MAVNPTLTITIDRASMSLPPLEFSGRLDGTTLGVVEYQAPARVSRVDYVPDVAGVHGSEAQAWSWEQAILGWSFVRVGATTEAQLQASYGEVVAALGRRSYTITTQVSDAAPETWACDPGSVTPAPRDLVNLRHLGTVYAVTVPVYPIPGS